MMKAIIQLLIKWALFSWIDKPIKNVIISIILGVQDLPQVKKQKKKEEKLKLLAKLKRI